MKYRKKPVVVDAIQWTGWIWPPDDAPEWVNRAFEDGTIYSCNNDTVGAWVSYLYIDTLEGAMEVSEQDWIIKGIKDELYPCKPDVFDETYEKVEGE